MVEFNFFFQCSPPVHYVLINIKHNVKKTFLHHFKFSHQKLNGNVGNGGEGCGWVWVTVGGLFQAKSNYNGSIKCMVQLKNLPASIYVRNFCIDSFKIYF